MSNDKLKSEANPSLVVLRDNKPKWYLPESRREGYRNLHKINRYGLLHRSDLVLKLNKKHNKKIENIPSVKKAINHKYFCSLLVGKDQEILFEKYASDFTEKTYQTIMSITKMFVNLFIGELLEKKLIDLNKKISTIFAKISNLNDVTHKIGPFIFFPLKKVIMLDEKIKVELTGKEVDILKCLLSAAGEAVDKDKLLKQVWNYSSDVTTHTLETHIYRLRQKLEADTSIPRLIISQAGGFSIRTL